jgi:hypothetical protein
MRWRLLGVALAFSLAVAGPARADIFGVAPVVAPGHSNIDVGLIDVSTGQSLSLPAGVNTVAEESHPSISTDGEHLAFERLDPTAGTDRILVTDLSTGQTHDLVDAFTALTWHPTSPAISADGVSVATGTEGNGLFRWGANAPGSFSREDAFPGSELVDPTPTTLGHPALYAFRRNLPQPNGVTRGQVLVEDVPGASGPLAVNSASVSGAHPAIDVSGDHNRMVYDIRGVDSSGHLEQGDIAFCLIFLHNGGPCGLGQATLPPLVNSPRDETRPAFTPDGRYIGFIRDEASGHERVYVFDTETQTLVDSDGADLGLVATLDTGNLSLYERPVLKSTNFPQFGTVVTNLGVAAPIGLFVQRVVGHHRLLGRRVPILKTIGRIPLGQFQRGRHKIHWQPVVNGRRLSPGLYQFTVRALTKSGRIRDLGKPRQLRIR